MEGQETARDGTGVAPGAPGEATVDAPPPPPLDPFEPGFFGDPYAQYARTRERAAVHRTAIGLIVTRYDECFGVLRAPGTSADERNATESLRFRPPDDDERVERGRHAILNLDPPDHTRLRRLVSSAFTVRRVEQLRTRVQHLVGELLDDVAAAGAGGEPVDLVGRFAFPLPFQVITDLLGMPPGNRDELRAWSHDITRFLEPLMTPDELTAALEASDLMEAHLRDTIEWKRRNMADDLLSAMIAAEEDGDRMSLVELVDQVRLFYIAGHETTVNLIGNGTLALLHHRDQLERLAADPALDGNAVDELLRYDSPVQLSRRIALTDLEVGDETASPGDTVLTMLGSANRDPAKWGPTAADLDLGRDGASAHLSFGSGIHHCLGAALARLEGTEAVPALVRRFPRIELAGDGPRRNGRLVLRGLDALPVTLSA
jgi:cytochrome P450